MQSSKWSIPSESIHQQHNLHQHKISQTEKEVILASPTRDSFYDIDILANPLEDVRNFQGGNIIY